ncbi:hypothetical protein FHT36_000738 [Xanthobacter sp. SG618]|uniref:hypothetical protein n=1 Tax=Xanthobacter sp. SG618 TaxID=2587121 RepID=UPI00145F1D22|nr:hypothetical protein [Xanthobacter sp. SG618]NMN56860.1 hypothetical protein [Xanthobacter sp. SG618]
MLPFIQAYAMWANIPLLTAAAVPSIAFRAGYSDGANASSYTFAGCDIGAAPPAGETREVFVAVGWYQGGSASRTLSSVTIGGIAATLETPFNNGVLQALCVARAVVPTGTTADIALTFSNTVQSCNLAAYRVMNRPSAAAGASDTGSATFSAATSVGVAGMDVGAGGFILSAVAWGNTVSAPALSGLGAGSDAFLTPEATGYVAFGSAPLQASASTGNTLTWTWTTSRSGFAAAWAF